MNAGGKGVCMQTGEEKDEEAGNVNEVTYLLIGNKLRLRVFNESARVSLHACECLPTEVEKQIEDK